MDRSYERKWSGICLSLVSINGKRKAESEGGTNSSIWIYNKVKIFWKIIAIFSTELTFSHGITF